jgi:hypothetical protein
MLVGMAAKVTVPFLALSSFADAAINRNKSICWLDFFLCIATSTKEGKGRMPISLLFSNI